MACGSLLLEVPVPVPMPVPAAGRPDRDPGGWQWLRRRRGCGRRSLGRGGHGRLRPPDRFRHRGDMPPRTAAEPAKAPSSGGGPANAVPLCHPVEAPVMPAPSPGGGGDLAALYRRVEQRRGPHRAHGLRRRIRGHRLPGSTRPRGDGRARPRGRARHPLRDDSSDTTGEVIGVDESRTSRSSGPRAPSPATSSLSALPTPTSGPRSRPSATRLRVRDRSPGAPFPPCSPAHPDGCRGQSRQQRGTAVDGGRDGGRHRRREEPRRRGHRLRLHAMAAAPLLHAWQAAPARSGSVAAARAPPARRDRRGRDRRDLARRRCRHRRDPPHVRDRHQHGRLRGGLRPARARRARTELP